MMTAPPFLQRIAAAVIRRRASLPRWVNGALESVAKSPDSVFSRLVSRLLGGAGSPPAPTDVPDARIRVYIGPTNYSGQGWLWARALEESDPDIGARNLSLEIPGTFRFPGDSQVPVVTQNASPAWQRAELEAVGAFTHVLVEAERSLFGPLLSWSLDAERRELERRGLSLAYIAHGTDVRSPRRHVELTPWSPYRTPSDPRLQQDADRNSAFLADVGCPVFVSTPDLLIDVPWATWCPVVVDVDTWRTDRQLLALGTPVIAHAPTSPELKGTPLIEPAVSRIAQDGLATYRRILGVASSEMPQVVASCDILLDQFRIGSYGVAAVEAMAAGRVVIGHVIEPVRSLVRESTGLELPVVEATPDTLESTLHELIANPSRMVDLGHAGVQYSTTVHSGARSARILIDQWIRRT